MVMSATNQIAGNASHDYQYDDYTNSNQQYNYPPNYQHQISGESIQIVVNDVDIDPQQKYDSKYNSTNSAKIRDFFCHWHFTEFT